MEETSGDGSVVEAPLPLHLELRLLSLPMPAPLLLLLLLLLLLVGVETSPNRKSDEFGGGSGVFPVDDGRKNDIKLIGIECRLSSIANGLSSEDASGALSCGVAKVLTSTA